MHPPARRQAYGVCMARRRVIVGVGVAVLAEASDREIPAGVALQVPLHAVTAGHEGIAIARLGQDATANQLLSVLRESGVDVRHLQSDPDLPTGRARLGRDGRLERLDDNAAFDQLQWDFDLSDVAQRADAVVFDALMRRSGQTRSAADRFLDECTRAMRVFDMTGCDFDKLDRSDILSGLEHATIVVVDDSALRMLLPGAAEGPPRDPAKELLRRGGLDMVLVAQPGRPFSAHTADASAAAETGYERDTHAATLIGFLHRTMSGMELTESVRAASARG